MWILYFHIILLLLPHLYCSSIFIPTADIVKEALENYRNSTKDNTSTQKESDSMMCLRQYRKKSYISSAECTLSNTERPISEPICSGRCVPKDSIPIELFTGKHYRCKPGKKVTKEIKLLCHPDSRLVKIKIKVVDHCKCVLTDKKRKGKKNKKRRRRKNKNKTDTNSDRTKKHGKNRHRRRNRRKQRKHKKSSKLTNNDR